MTDRADRILHDAIFGAECYALDFTREDDARARVLLGEGDISYKAVVTLAAVARIVAETVWYTMPLNTLNELLETLQRNTAEALAAIDGSI